MATKTSVDQAEDLRKQVEKKRMVDEIEGSPLPPRSEYHKTKKNKRRKFQIRFPLVRFLLILFFIIVILALSSPTWLEYIQ